MNVLTFSEVRASLKSVMDVITRVDGEHVVMLSLADFNSMQETMYLLGSPKNASRLMESVAQIKAGKAKQRDLVHHEEQKDRRQAAS